MLKIIEVPAPRAEYYAGRKDYREYCKNIPDREMIDGVPHVLKQYNFYGVKTPSAGAQIVLQIQAEYRPVKEI